MELRVRRNNSLDAFMESFCGDWNSGLLGLYDPLCKYTRRFPSYEIREDDSKVIITLEAVGFDKEEITLEIIKGEILVSAVHKEEKDNSKFSRSFEERFKLKDCAFDKIEAGLDKGLLTITIPKIIKKELETRKIDIK